MVAATPLPAAPHVLSIRPTSILPIPVGALALGLWVACSQQAAPPEQMAFFKGNTHTHTLWSDGDASPDWVTAWYQERDYDFLVLSEHNIVADHERWFAVSDGGRLTPERFSALQQQFGVDVVQVRDTADGGQEMRLPTLGELRSRFEVAGEFILITGEEVTDGFEGKNVHINAFNLASVIPPQHGTSLMETVNSNLAAIELHGIEHGRPVLAHLNHPNFTWSLTQENLAAAPALRSFEIYNGHPSVNNRGDETRPSTEAMWDFVNQAAAQEGRPLCLGVATDDAHHYHEMKFGRSNPGRGWMQVAAKDLSPESILAAMEAGNFYGSSGVELHSFERNAKGYRVQVLAEEGVSYRIQFYGARSDGTRGLLDEVVGTETTFTPGADVLFVRAQVVSDRPHPNPAEEGETECAWLQPYLGPAGQSGSL